jgi:hypothetical protein
VFELVNLSSGNRIGDYATEEEALLDIWSVIERRGPAAVASIALMHVLDDGSGKKGSEGEDLVHRARNAARHRGLPISEALT